MFVISPGGYVFERFWNQANWVYVRHNGLPSSPIVQVSTIKQGGTLFASTAEEFCISGSPVAFQVHCIGKRYHTKVANFSKEVSLRA